MEPHICYLCIYTPFGVLAFFLRSTKQDGLNVQKKNEGIWAVRIGSTLKAAGELDLDALVDELARSSVVSLRPA